MNDDRLASAYRGTAPPSSHLTETAWEALLDGTLPAAEREAAREHITRCNACATVYQGLAMFERESRELGAPGRVVSPFRISLRSWPASLAAMLVIGAAAGLFYRSARPSPGDGSALPTTVAVARVDSIEPLAVRVAQSRAVTNRGPVSNQAFLEAFNLAIEPYRARQFPAAATRLADLGGTFPDAAEPPLYEGVARLLAGDPDAAMAPLDRAARLASGTEWLPDAEYYGARARLAAGRDEGRQTLVKLCATPGPYQSQSCRASAR